MNYYTSTIPVTLAEKLKEKGMPIEVQPLYAQEAPNARGIVKAGVGLRCPSYAEVFDWLLDKHEAFVYVTCLRMDEGWQYCGGIWGFGIDMNFGWFPSWHEAANTAIEKALTLI